MIPEFLDETLQRDLQVEHISVSAITTQSKRINISAHCYGMRLFVYIHFTVSLFLFAKRKIRMVIQDIYLNVFNKF